MVKKAGYIFQQAELRSYFANDTDGVRPHVSIVVFSFSSAGDTEWLTWLWEPSGNDVDKSLPLSSVKPPNVIKYWKPGKNPVFLPLHQDLLAIVIDFDGTDTLVTNKDVAKYPSSSPCK
jgi:hypothetical protein